MKESVKKNIIRGVAGALLVALLLALASAGENSPALLNEPVESQPLPVADIDVSNMARSQEGTVSALLCLYDDPNVSLSFGGLVCVYWLNVNGDGSIDMLNVPTGTRVAMPVADGKYSHGTPAQAYQAGRALGEPWGVLAEAVRGLFYDVELDYVISLDASGLAGAVDELGGLYVRWDNYSLSTGGSVQEDLPRERSVLLSGERVLQYIAAGAAGTDVGALDRQNHIAEVFFERISFLEDPFAWLAACADGFEHNVQKEDQKALISALKHGGIGIGILPGEQRMIEDQSWMPKKTEIKAYVLGRYYSLPGE